MITRFRTVLVMRTVLKQAAWAAGVVALVVAVAACGDDDTTAPAGGRPSIVATSNIVGDVVRHLAGDDAEVEVLMPPNASPHDFAPSARQATDMREADVLVVNGLGFESGLQDAVVVRGIDGVEVVSVAELAPDRLPFGDGPEAEDPHVFTDPARMAVATAALAERLAELVPDLDTPAVRERAATYVHELEALDAEVVQILSVVPPERRVLVTNHDVFGYFAERYGFEVLGVIIPGGDTLAEPSGADLADLASAISDAGVPAIFADTSSPTRLADALAAEGADVDVVELYSESLGEPGSGAATYVGLIRTDAERIAAALAS
jgi:zinc/manganese transport system substrate-binding protein